MPRKSDAATAGASLSVGACSVTLRPVQPRDLEFLAAIYASTRAGELAAVDWPPEAQRRFLRQQFDAQDHAYRHNYPGARFSIIVIDGVDAGRLYVHHRPGEIRIMDIALLPHHRGRGVGSRLLREIMREGEATHRPVTIHVEVFNPAQRFYERLGFTPVAESDVYRLMEWRAAARPLSPTGG